MSIGFIDFDITILLLLFLVSFCAGFVDSIAGGGGMITIPALLLSGVSPIEALGTNKLQSSFGSFSATCSFYQKGYINLQKSFPLAILVFIFSGLGTISVQFIDTAFLSKFLPFLVLSFGVYFLFAPKITEESQKKPQITLLFFALAGIGFYDGFFGPGTGSFLMIALLVFGGYGLTCSLAHAKLYNFSTNFASVVFFALGGNILWGLGFIMAIGQFFGARLGSRAAMKYGIKIIKPLIVLVSFLMSVKLLYEQFML